MLAASEKKKRAAKPKPAKPKSASKGKPTATRVGAPATAAKRRDPRREVRFPAIEKRYGEPMAHWFKVMAKLEGRRYPEQMKHLQENHGFSREHANALVMYSRGSTSTQRFAGPKEYFESINPTQKKTARAIFAAIARKYPKLEFVIAWNQPMLRDGKFYVFGLSASKGHILINPFSADVIAGFAPKLKGLRVAKRTIALPNDWSVDAKLLQALVAARLAER